MNLQKDTDELLKKDLLTEREIQTIKNRVNNKAVEVSFDKEYLLTPEQNQKGYDWIYNQYKTPRGIERKNNPFGYREQAVIDNFSHFTWSDIYDTGNSYHSWYAPVWTMYAKDGNSFSYYVSGGECNIIG